MKNGFILYKGMYEPIKNLSDEKFGKLMKTIFEYQSNGTEKKLDNEIQMAFLFFKNQFDIDNNKYLDICKKRQEQGKKGGLAKASKSYQALAKPSKSSLKDKDKDKVNKETNIELEDWLKHWNSIFIEKRQITTPLIKEYTRIRKDYSYADFKRGYNAYKNKKLETKKEYGEFKYLLSPLAFLKNIKNGYVSYL